MEPWRAPKYCRRAWCVFELHTALQAIGIHWHGHWHRFTVTETSGDCQNFHAFQVMLTCCVARRESWTSWCLLVRPFASFCNLSRDAFFALSQCVPGVMWRIKLHALHTISTYMSRHVPPCSVLNVKAQGFAQAVYDGDGLQDLPLRVGLA